MEAFVTRPADCWSSHCERLFALTLHAAVRLPYKVRREGHTLTAGSIHPPTISRANHLRRTRGIFCLMLATTTAAMTSQMLDPCRADAERELPERTPTPNCRPDTHEMPFSWRQADRDRPVFGTLFFLAYVQRETRFPPCRPTRCPQEWLSPPLEA